MRKEFSPTVPSAGAEREQSKALKLESVFYSAAVRNRFGGSTSSSVRLSLCSARGARRQTETQSKRDESAMRTERQRRGEREEEGERRREMAHFLLKLLYVLFLSPSRLSLVS